MLNFEIQIVHNFRRLLPCPTLTKDTELSNETLSRVYYLLRKCTLPNLTTTQYENMAYQFITTWLHTQNNNTHLQMQTLLNFTLPQLTASRKWPLGSYRNISKPLPPTAPAPLNGPVKTNLKRTKQNLGISIFNPPMLKITPAKTSTGRTRVQVTSSYRSGIV